MDKVFTFKPMEGKTKHIAIPNSISEGEDVEYMVPYCGRFLRNKEGKEKHENIEEAMKNEKTCMNCLVSLGAIKSPKLKNEN